MQRGSFARKTSVFLFLYSSYGSNYDSDYDSNYDSNYDSDYDSDYDSSVILIFIIIL